MRLAVIDLGTNTVRLLVVELRGDWTWTPIVEDQRVTRLGEGLAASQRLGEAPMERTAKMVAEYSERAARAGAATIHIVATSAVRDAANGAEFAKRIERETGHRVAIISGEDEARLTVRGIAAGLGDPTATRLAFDIGGGSTEYILARGGGIDTAVSLRLGVVPLAERYASAGPIERERYRAMESDVCAQLFRELPAPLRATGCRELTGTAGTVTTLAALDLGLTTYDGRRVQGHRLARAAIERLRDTLCALTLAERAALPCLEPGRADLIVPGVAIVIASLDVTSTTGVVTSDWGLREGMMAEAIEHLR